MKWWYTYILASKKRGVLYVWVTSNLYERIGQHKQEVVDWFTKKYHIHHLVWFQEFPTIIEAIEWEKKIKWRVREKKIALIEKGNPYRDDLMQWEDSLKN